MLAHKVLVHQVAVYRLQMRVDAAGYPRHSRHLLHHHGIMHGIVRIFTPGEGAMLIDHYPRPVQRFALTQGFNDHPAGIEFVLPLHLLFG